MSQITSAAFERESESAAYSIAKMLGMAEIADVQDQAEWRGASTDQRIMWIAEWMRAAAYAEIDRLNGPGIEWVPMGGMKYAHQND